MKSNKIVTIEHLSDMKPFPIHGLNKKHNDNICIYGKSGEGRTVDVIKLKDTFDKQESNNH